MNTQSTDQGFDFEDFKEAPHLSRTKEVRPILIGVGGAFMAVILAIVLISGSLPELSPEQIVAMEGYQGEQAPRQIFNLDSLSDVSISRRNDSGSAVDKNKSNQATEASSQTLNEQQHVASSDAAMPNGAVNVALAPSLASEDTISGDASDLIAAVLTIETEEPNDSWAQEIVDVPASPIIIGKDAQEMAAPVVEVFDYRKLNRRRAVSAQNTGSPNRMAAVQTAQNDSLRIKVLPVLMVNTDNTSIRAEPILSSDVKLVLGKGSSVTAFEQAGAWIHVGVNDGSSITGYVHQSKIAASEIN